MSSGAVSPAPGAYGHGAVVWGDSVSGGVCRIDPLCKNEVSLSEPGNLWLLCLNRVNINLCKSVLLKPEQVSASLVLNAEGWHIPRVSIWWLRVTWTLHFQQSSGEATDSTGTNHGLCLPAGINISDRDD
jgi:hypothetical protein